MADHIETRRSISQADGLLERFFYWLFLEGDRLLITGIALVGVFAVLASMTAAGYFAVGPRSIAGSLFASGLTSGILTVVTIILSINQLILSRVFGSPGELTSKLDGTKEFRERVETIAERPSTPNDPAHFLSVVARTLSERSGALRETLAREPGFGEGDTLAILADVGAYGDSLESHLEAETPIKDVLAVLLGTEYAQNMTAVRHARQSASDRLDASQRDSFEAIEQLLELIAISRQFFKTLTLQRDFARLSRITAMTGLLAFFTTVSLTLLYQSTAVTVPASWMPLLVSVGLTIIAAPVIVVIVYVLRAATIARHTVSVGPFVPPGE